MASLGVVWHHWASCGMTWSLWHHWVPHGTTGSPMAPLNDEGWKRPRPPPRPQPMSININQTPVWGTQEMDVCAKAKSQLLQQGEEERRLCKHFSPQHHGTVTPIKTPSPAGSPDTLPGSTAQPQAQPAPHHRNHSITIF